MTVAAYPFKLEDAAAICRDLSQEERRVFTALSGQEFDPEAAAARGYLTTGLSWVFVGVGLPIAVGGLNEVIPGVRRSWFYATDTAWEAYGRELTAVVRGIIAEALAEGSTRRIETLTLASQTRAREWYEKIGLRYESTLRNYGINGEDAVLYVALRDAESKSV